MAIPEASNPSARTLGRSGLLDRPRLHRQHRPPSIRAENDGFHLLPTYTPPREANSAADNQIALVAAASHDQLNSTFANTGFHKQHSPTITIHPIDASRLDLTHDEPVIAANERGEFTAQLVVDDRARPGVAMSQKESWAKQQSTINVLTAEADADMGRGATFHDNLVTLTPASNQAVQM